MLRTHDRRVLMLIYFGLAVMIIMIYGYAASAPHSNWFDANPTGRGSPREGLYALAGIAIIVGIAYFFLKR